jgi:membrane-bound metal-dependent hydrolase YbcI (DUF457 family)
MIFFFAFYGKKAIPYYAVLLSHVLVGDFFTGGVELFWPFYDGLIQFLNLEVTSLPSVAAELVLFLTTLPAMYKLGDLQTLLKFNSKSWILFVPLGALLGPLLSIGRGQESALPLLLVVPSLFYLVLFSYALIIWLKQHSLKQPPERS